MDLPTAPNTNNRGSSRQRSRAKRSRRSGGDSVGNYFGDAWSLAKRTAYGLNEIRKLINVEHKYIDVNASSASSRAGVITYLSPAGQGDDITQREGDSIKVQSFEITGLVYRDSAATTNSEAIRILILRDLQNTGASPTGNDIVENVSTQYAPYQPLDFLNGSDLNKRFTIVYDNLVNLDLQTTCKAFSFKSMHDCHVFYRGTTNAVASAGNGSYFMLVLSSNSTLTSNVDFTSRLRFTDN